MIWIIGWCCLSVAAAVLWHLFIKGTKAPVLNQSECQHKWPKHEGQGLGVYCEGCSIEKYTFDVIDHFVKEKQNESSMARSDDGPSLPRLEGASRYPFGAKDPDPWLH